MSDGHIGFQGIDRGEIQSQAITDLLRHLPWSVLTFAREKAVFRTRIEGSERDRAILEFPLDNIKLVQFVGKLEVAKECYIELRTTPKSWFIGTPHRIYYLGEAAESRLQALHSKLRELKINWVWYQAPRSKDQLLPPVSAITVR